MPIGFHEIFRQPVNGEDIDGDAYFGVSRFDEPRAVIVDFGEGIGVRRVVLERRYGVVGAEEFRGDAEKFQIVFSGHEDIDVIIPWDEALMPDRTDAAPSAQKKRKTVFFTEQFEIF